MKKNHIHRPLKRHIGFSAYVPDAQRVNRTGRHLLSLSAPLEFFVNSARKGRCEENGVEKVENGEEGKRSVFCLRTPSFTKALLRARRRRS